MTIHLAALTFSLSRLLADAQPIVSVDQPLPRAMGGFHLASVVSAPLRISAPASELALTAREQTYMRQALYRSRKVVGQIKRVQQA